MKDISQLQRNFANTSKLLIYRSLMADKVIRDLKELILHNHNTEEQSKYNQICSELIKFAEENKLTGDIWQNYLLWLIATDENVFSLTCEKQTTNLKSIYEIAVRDFAILKDIYQFSFSEIGQVLEVDSPGLIQNYHPSTTTHTLLYRKIDLLRESFTQKSPADIADVFIELYHQTGSAQLGLFKAFRWRKETGLTGIKNLDPITFADIIGYETQKDKLINNTESFLKGHKANNVLLYGDSGTGKSSSVKALINKYANQGLRLVEITKDEIKFLPEIMEILKERGLYFIIFLDDLSFEDFENEYIYMKSIMEGGIEVKPDNVLFYATSNRRNLIKEKWSDRNSESGEVHLSDYMQERFSLVERFGITIVYQSPGKQEYLQIISKLAERNKLSLSETELKERAIRWEMWHNGRSGRTARQFINYLLGEAK